MQQPCCPVCLEEVLASQDAKILICKKREGCSGLDGAPAECHAGCVDDHILRLIKNRNSSSARLALGVMTNFLCPGGCGKLIKETKCRPACNPEAKLQSKKAKEDLFANLAADHNASWQAKLAAKREKAAAAAKHPRPTQQQQQQQAALAFVQSPAKAPGLSVAERLHASSPPAAVVGLDEESAIDDGINIKRRSHRSRGAVKKSVLAAIDAADAAEALAAADAADAAEARALADAAAAAAAAEEAAAAEKEAHKELYIDLLRTLLYPSS